MTGPYSFRSALRATTSALLLLLACLVLTAPALAADTPVAIENAENVAGSRDALGLVNLGSGTCAIHTFVSVGGALDREQSRKVTLVFSRARFVAGDVNGDGLTDGIVLYNMGDRRARLYVMLSNGTGFTKKKIAWTSAKGAFTWSRAKLAVGDINADNKDDVVVLYDRGRGRAELRRFISKGSTFKMSVGWKCGRGGLYASRAQLAIGDATGDGKADAIVLYRGSPSRLLTFTTKGSTFVKKTFWKGAYPAAKLAAGDLDSDGDVDAVCLRADGDGRMALDAFLSDKSAFAAPAPWWVSEAGAVATTARLACGDLDANGMADAVLLTPTAEGSFAVACASTGSAFEPGAWWRGPATAGSTRLACGPGSPIILREKTVVLSDEALAALQQVDTEGTVYTFTSGVPQVDGLATDDVIAFQPCAPLPYGALRKVTSVAVGGGETVVTTVQATLEEAVSEGELAIDETCSQDDIVEVLESKPGVRLVQRVGPEDRALARRHGASVGGTWEIVYDVTLEDLVTLEGRLTFEQTFSLGSSWGVTGYALGFIPLYGMKSVRFVSETVQTTSVEASLEAELEKRVETDLATYSMKTFVVWFGPVPVTFTPEVTLYVGASGDVTVGVRTGFETVTTVTAGLQWKRGQGWSTIKGFTNTREFTPPHLYGQAELRAFAGLEAMLKIYYLAGPTAGLEAYLGLTADTDAVPWWELAAGLDLTLGFKVEVIDYETQTAFNLFEIPLASASGGYKKKGLVSGRVLTGGGTTPLDGATVELRQGADSPDGALVATTMAADDGAYGFADLSAGSYTVVASKEPVFAANDRTVAVTGGAATTGQDVELTGAPGVGGMVAQDGDPIGDVTVELHRGWDAPSGPLVTTVVTSSTGEYAFTDLAPGDYTVVASRSGYFTRRISVTVADSFVAGRDIDLNDLSEQGVTGYVLDGPDGSGVDGATVTLHEGYRDPDGRVVATTTSSYGFWQFEHVTADQDANGMSFYTVVATKDGYVRGIEEVVVYEGQWTTDVYFSIAVTDAVSPAEADSADDSIAWPGKGVENGNATYELWFKPSSTDKGRIAEIAFWYWNYPGPVWELAPIMRLDYTAANTVAFAVNQSRGDEPGDGTWHEIQSTTQLQTGQWYHIAAQNGSLGMRLYVDGHLEASDPYTGRPEADWSGALPTDGRFCLGEHGLWAGDATARGQYMWLRVSKVQRHYLGDFTPPETPRWDSSVDVLDALIGDTNGWNLGFSWEP